MAPLGARGLDGPAPGLRPAELRDAVRRRGPSTIARSTIGFPYADESDPGPYPFARDTPIEGGSDRHALMVERGTCRLYELFAAEWNDGDPQAGSGAIFDLDSNRAAARDVDLGRRGRAADLRRPGALGRGQAGEHRARDPVHRRCTTDAYIWPARHEAGVRRPATARRWAPGSGSGRTSTCQGFSPKARTILRAMQRYGLIAGRQRLRLVLPGHARRPLAQPAPRPAEDGAGVGFRGGGRERRAWSTSTRARPIARDGTLRGSRPRRAPRPIRTRTPPSTGSRPDR